ncbi:peptide/nickel transport system permease protein [Microvirga lupini]|uniref:Peptide/nickel transport system permease protein n=1 Tax=Microvirga lupini TaxID=420324 RepID=A0A7W4VPM5_9HYPH|nr:ABC transporter permease [Microvirga lupini]MBB3020968.1 peptide/nickel transport system permease protein [Microvirga lupini]
MITFILRRLMAAVPVLAVVTILVFSLLYFAPGDPATIIGGDLATPEEIARIRSVLGLDQPFLVRLAIFLGQLLTGDLGTSIFSNLPVTHLIAQRIEPTLALATVTILFSIAVAIPLGTLSAWKAEALIDRLVMVVSVLGFSIPVFVLGYGLIWLFAIKLQWLPVQGYTPLSQGVGPWLANLVLPMLSLSTVYIALIARITRASLLEVLAQDYVRTAKAKGLGDRKVLGHALGNAAVPIATIVGIGIALLIGGVVVTETVFAIPGLGRLLVDAILRRDYPIIQGVILLFAAAYVLINLMIDISYAVFDPRIRY